MIQVSGNVFSNEADLSKALRWIGIASAAVNKLDYAVPVVFTRPKALSRQYWQVLRP